MKPRPSLLKRLCALAKCHHPWLLTTGSVPFATIWKCYGDLNYPLLVTKQVQVDPKDYKVLSVVLNLACAEKHLESFSALPIPGHLSLWEKV